ncbi:hypothetical protein PM082_021310 [Marasmius tenuissimus]|nr:hypothetical protein PM082_021310 [Marasmius tenuissimus]
MTKPHLEITTYNWTNWSEKVEISAATGQSHSHYIVQLSATAKRRERDHTKNSMSETETYPSTFGINSVSHAPPYICDV